jgi:starch synthase
LYFEVRWTVSNDIDPSLTIYNGRAMPLKILLLGAEVAPFAKTGGLADVCGALPKALRGMGHDVRVVMPAYQNIEAAFNAGKWGLEAIPGQLQVPVGRSLIPAGVFQTTLPGTYVPVYFIAERNLLGRPNIYGYNDDAYRFSFFSRAALDLFPALGWRPDIVHAHDWHSAPAITWLATTGQFDVRYRGIPTLYTIHNLAHQGRTSWNIFDYLGILTHGLREEGFGEVNFMARGIYHATMINTVSPSYAREILTPDGGANLHGLLQFRHFDVHGILNGLDTDVWNPMTDSHLTQNFDAAHLDRRIHNKLALQARLNLPQNAEVPLIGMVSRLDHQKGIDIVGHVVHLLMNNFAGEAQFVVLGSGNKSYEDMFAFLAAYHSHKMSAIFGQSPDLAPLIYGGTDMFLMPSRFEPCGLSQMIAMRYGSVPVVRATGGLADTVHDGITGFTFYDYSTTDFWNAIKGALYIYHNDRDSWKAMQLEGMSLDFSWQHSAHGYQQLYEWAIARAIG